MTTITSKRRARIQRTTDGYHDDLHVPDDVYYSLAAGYEDSFWVWFDGVFRGTPMHARYIGARTTDSVAVTAIGADDPMEQWRAEHGDATDKQVAHRLIADIIRLVGGTTRPLAPSTQLRALSGQLRRVVDKAQNGSKVGGPGDDTITYARWYALHNVAERMVEFANALDTAVKREADLPEPEYPPDQELSF